VALTLPACGTMQATPAQERAYELIEKCKDVNMNVIVQRVDADGRVWAEMRNGTVGYDEWRQCMAKAAQEREATESKK
jgi:hypothetical protein